MTVCRSRSGRRRRSQPTRWRSACSHELVDAAFLGQSGVDVAARVDADAVDMAALQAGEHRSFRIADADIGGLAVVFLLGDVEIAVLAAGDVIGAPHAGPLTKEVTVGREDLDALVRSIGHIK